MTTCINAVTAPALVTWLGITALPADQLKLLKMLSRQLVEWSNDKSHPAEVGNGLAHMLHEIEHHIDHQATANESKSGKKAAPEGGVWRHD